jgi:hypothetical protein
MSFITGFSPRPLGTIFRRRRSSTNNRFEQVRRSREPIGDGQTEVGDARLEIVVKARERAQRDHGVVGADEGEGRHRHARSGAIRVWARQDDRGSTDRACYRITARRKSRRISRNGWIAKRWSMSAAPLITRGPRQDRRWRQTLKNRILLEYYYLPGDL